MCNIFFHVVEEDSEVSGLLLITDNCAGLPLVESGLVGVGVGGDGCSAAPSHDGPLVLPEWPPAQVLESSFSMILCPVQVSSSECAS